jgi:hypothetical protein
MIGIDEQKVGLGEQKALTYQLNGEFNNIVTGDGNNCQKL